MRRSSKFFTFLGMGIASNAATIGVALGLPSTVGGSDLGAAVAVGAGLLSGTPLGLRLAKAHWTRRALRWHRRLDRAVARVASMLEERSARRATGPAEGPPSLPHKVEPLD